jgi:hypothetical protein
VIDVVSGLLSLFLLVVMAVLWLAARLSGWSRLAASYRLDAPVETTGWRWVSVGCGPIFRFNGCLTVRITPRGLSLRMIPPLRPFCPSLLIPWDRIAAPASTRRGLGDAVALSIEPEAVRLTFPKRDYERMRPELPAHLRIV